jgi:ABC-2 type transport system ATP-binding protein
MEILRQQPWTVETSIFGSAFHISVDSSDREQFMIKQTLAQNKIDVTQIEKIVPSLEDVFLHLIDAEDGK